MIKLERFTPTTADEWNQTILRFNDASILQSWEWAQIKRMNGWQPIFLRWINDDADCVASVCIHKKTVPIFGRLFGTCLMYAPRGPVLNWKDQPLTEQVFSDLQQFTREQHAIFLKIDPAVAVSSHVSKEMIFSATESDLQKRLISCGWVYSQDQLQFKNTVLLDLNLTEDILLERMKQKTRYNIRLADRKGVEVSIAGDDDLKELYRLYAETATRDGFVIRTRDYYLSVWRSLIEAGIAYPLIARYQGKIISGLILFVFGSTATYFYGMSTDQFREVMPNYLLQWEAIKLAKSKGCTVYDFWGAPDNFTDEDRLSGVYRFKEGFNGSIFLGIGAWDYPTSPLLYRLYTSVLPSILNIMRSGARKRIVGEVNG